MDKKYKLLLTIVSYYRKIMLVSVIIVVVTANALSDQWTPLSIAVFVIGGIALLLYGQRWVTQYKSQKILNILMEDCDPDGYIKVHRYLINQLTEQKAPPVLWLNLSVGLSAAGKHDQALQVLEHHDWIRRIRSKMVRLMYYHNLASEYIRQKDFNSAGKLLSLVEHMVPKLKLSKSLRQKFQQTCLQNRHKIKMAQGDYTDAEAVFTARYEHAENRYERVTAKMTLANIYTHFGDTAKAKDAYQYVITHGNKLHIVTLTKEKLHTL